MKNIHAWIAEIVQQQNEAEKIFAQQEEKYASLRGSTEDELADRRESLLKLLDELNTKKADLEKNGFTKRIEKCRVVASTVDNCLSRVLPDDESFQFKHVFLDEAGYCAVIKGCTLLSYGVPVTFLGDHKQLPPVCEMNDADMNNETDWLTFLWAQSAIYAEEVLTKGCRNAARTYFGHWDALFRMMKKYDLTQSFRFGEKLAEVLAGAVYSSEFHGFSGNSTEIYYMDAPRENAGKIRANPAECAVIKAYILSHADEEIGVLTPYRKQLDDLKKELSKIAFPKDSVVTVHGAQGREWDTVLFSVVDTGNKWFTSSLNPQSGGEFVVNTAVSRTKKKLVLVCDYRYWSAQTNELIGRLLHEAREIKTGE